MLKNGIADVGKSTICSLLKKICLGKLRKWLISLLYHPVDEVRSLSQDQLDRIIEEYPIIGRVYDAVKGFKGALFGKKEAELDKWAEENRSS